MTQSIAATAISSCEVCLGRRLDPVLDLGMHPMCDDLVPLGEDRSCQEFPIEIVFCPTCLTAHQRYQIPKATLFPKSYHYRSRFTSDVLNGMRQLADDAVAMLSGRPSPVVLDVGCNDGSLLDFFVAKGCIAIGVEPTGAAEDARAKGHTVYSDYFDPRLAARIAASHPRIDLITFTNVFAHIEDLGSVLEALNLLIGERTVLVIENHYLGSIVSGGQFDTFYHEHPRSYGVTSFAHIARRLGLRISRCDFPSRYGGNIRVTMGRDGAADLDRLIAARDEAGFASKLAAMGGRIAAWRAAKLAQIDELVRTHGPLPAKAFPGRAAILIKLLGLDVDSIARVHEKPGSIKVGHYLPGTRIPIVSDAELGTGDGSAPVLLNLAWHISPEIRGYLAGLGYRGEVVDILSPRDLGA